MAMDAPAESAGTTVVTGVCFFRYEDNGILNVRPSFISADGKQLGFLEGGGINCVSLKPGNHEAYAYSSDPYDSDDTNQDSWRSQMIKFEVLDKHLIYIRIWPNSEHAAYTGPWKIEISKEPPPESIFDR